MADKDYKELPIFVRTVIDDMDLSLEAFRVYAHLSRRAGKNNHAWPSYQSIGDHCFRDVGSGRARKKAIIAVQELAEKKLIEVSERLIGNTKGKKSNVYKLKTLTEIQQYYKELPNPVQLESSKIDPPF